MAHSEFDGVVGKEECWRFDNFKNQNCHKLRMLLENRNYTVPSSATRARLLYLMSRYDHGLLCYEGCSSWELKQFCFQRNLSAPSPSGKRALITVLEQADGELPFHHFLELSAELRVMCYEFYFLSFAVLASATEPPIARTNRLVREEALPIFYSTCSFHVHLAPTRGDLVKLENGDITVRDITIINSPLDRISADELKWVRSITIDISDLQKRARRNQIAWIKDFAVCFRHSKLEQDLLQRLACIESHSEPQWLIESDMHIFKKIKGLQAPPAL